MGRNLITRVREYLTRQRQRKIGYALLGTLGALVVFCTTYALILPAITMSNDPICGFEAHTHSESCWSLETLDPEPELICTDWMEADVVYHTHDQLCYDHLGALICPIEERQLHIHDESCFLEERILICGLEGIDAEELEGMDGEPAVPEPVVTPEPEQPAYVPEPEPEPLPEIEVHVHDESCYIRIQGELICGMVEGEGAHVHDESCWYSEQTDWALICSEFGYTAEDLVNGVEIPEGAHIHDGSCYGPIVSMPELVCGMDESEGHFHTDACYFWEEELTCEKEEITPEMAEAMTAAIAAIIPEYIPEPEPETVPEPADPLEGVHIHTEECYEIAQTLVCEEEAVELHTHGPECYETIFQYDELGNVTGSEEILVCTLPVVIEHQHTEDCVYYQVNDEERETMVRTCGLPVHVHTDACYVDMGQPQDPYFCGIAEHMHSDECYFESGELRCTMPEHIHTDECLERDSAPETEYPLDTPLEPAEGENWICGMTEHVHTEEGCYVDGQLFCQEPEHVHTETCLPEESEDPNGEDGILDENGQPLPAGPETIEFNDFVYECETDDFYLTFRINGIATLPVDEEEGSNPYEPVQNTPVQNADDNLWDNRLSNMDMPVTEPEVTVPEVTEPVVTEPVEDVTGVPDAVEPDGEGRTLALDEEGETFTLGGEDETPAEPAGSFYDDIPNADADNEVFNSWNPDPAPVVDDTPGYGEALSYDEAPGYDDDATFSYPADEPVSASRWTPEDVEFRLETVTEGEEYDAIMAQADEIEGEQLMLQVMQIKAYVDGKELDISQCEITVEMRAKIALVEQLIEEAEAMQAQEEEPEQVVEPEDENGIMTFSASVTNESSFYAMDGAESQTSGTDVQVNNTVDNGKTRLDGEKDAEETVLYVSDAKGLLGSTTIRKNSQNVSTVFSVSGGAPFSIGAKSTPNPKFTVEYYANIDRVQPFVYKDNAYVEIDDKSTEVTKGGPSANDASKAGYLTVIDTSGKNLPENGGGVNSSEMPKRYLKVDFPAGSAITDPGKIVRTGKAPTEIFSSIDYTYADAPNLKYFNIFTGFADETEKSNYSLKTIKITHASEDNFYEESVTTFDNISLETLAYLHFTNRRQSASKFTDYKSGNLKEDFYILIQEGDTIRLICDRTTESEFKVGASFYDYDISTGRVHRAKPPEDPNQYVYKTAGQTFSGDSLTKEVLDWANELKTNGKPSWDGHLYAYTKEQGINSSGNYSGSGTKLAFGNVNTGTNLGKLYWGSNQLNKYNNNSYLGCTFGLVSSLKTDGTIQYASGINAPKLFNEGDATGKTGYNYNLHFDRVGDTYTLKAVDGTVATNLDYFNHPKNGQTTHTHILTNNFWPMDSAASFGTGTHDVKFGGSATFKGGAHEIRFGPITEKDGDYTFPESDDGLYHNSYFGMNFSVHFNLEATYQGPLEYYFFGDDDMWVFLDNTLVCDIGGVHSSVGEYVNLWDYMRDEDGNVKTGSHKLSFFYTERGASGSTCWMQFTLPSVTADIPEQQTSGLTVRKEVDGGAGKDTNQEFNFTITLKDENGKALLDDYRYIRYDKNGKAYNPEILEKDVVYTGADFQLKAGEYIKIEHLPVGTQYTVQEAPYPGYQPSYTIDGVLKEGEMADASITGGNTLTITNHYLYELPSTGGPSALVYTTGGMLLCMTAAGSLLYKKKPKRRGADDRT